MSGTRVEPGRTALLLHDLAAELLASEAGTERNGLFLELHRLLDTIFRDALECHPAAPPALAAQAFAVGDGLPAPQVLRELAALGSDLAQPEIRRAFDQVNAARNRMAHSATIERITVSRRHVKRMAHLARLVARTLDPTRPVAEPAGADGGMYGTGDAGLPLVLPGGLLLLVGGLVIGLTLRAGHPLVFAGLLFVGVGGLLLFASLRDG